MKGVYFCIGIHLIHVSSALGDHRVRCHQTQVTRFALTPARQGGTRFTYPMEDRVDLIC